MEACRIVCLLTDKNVIDVGAPMKDKKLCYEILNEAEHVIEATAFRHFSQHVKCLTIVMGADGRVDVAAPLPPRDLCGQMLDAALHIIERYNDEQAPVMQPFSEKLMGV